MLICSRDLRYVIWLFLLSYTFSPILLPSSPLPFCPSLDCKNISPFTKECAIFNILFLFRACFVFVKLEEQAHNCGSTSKPDIKHLLPYLPKLSSSNKQLLECGLQWLAWEWGRAMTRFPNLDLNPTLRIAPLRLLRVPHCPAHLGQILPWKGVICLDPFLHPQMLQMLKMFVSSGDVSESSPPT